MVRIHLGWLWNTKLTSGVQAFIEVLLAGIPVISFAARLRTYRGLNRARAAVVHVVGVGLNAHFADRVSIWCDLHISGLDVASDIKAVKDELISLWAAAIRADIDFMIVVDNR